MELSGLEHAAVLMSDATGSSAKLSRMQAALRAESAGAADGSKEFEARLREAQETAAAGSRDAERAARARATAEEFVATALVQPVLKELRESSTAWGPFAPGSHEKSFGFLFDSHIAGRIVQAKGFELVDIVARNLLKHGEVAASAAGGAPWRNPPSQ